jgi:hypothetical protein
MAWRRTIAVTLVALSAVAAAPRPAAHDVVFWRDIVRNNYAPPAAAAVPALVDELAALLGSPDPELRDAIAYSTLANWIYQRKIVGADALRRLTDRLLANLRAGLGERDTDSVFGRSFSALMLSVIAARDNADPFLAADDWRRIEREALAYLAAEHDVRGYDSGKGWIHSAAHTADLIKFLARSRHVDAAEQSRILDAVAGKLTTTPTVLSFGEDERFARALLSIVARADFDGDAFGAWLTRSKPAVDSRPTLAQLSASQNWKNTLAKLEVLLSNDPQPSEAVAAARTRLRAALKDLF